MRIKLSAWAKQTGISFKTAQRWFYTGNMPVPTDRTPTGRIMVVLEEPATKNERTVLYARVSSSDQKEDCVRQADRLRTLAAGQGWINVEVVAEIGSGLNGHRKQLVRLLSDPSVRRIVVEHRDRLARFGVEYIEAALKAQGREVVFAEAGEQKLDIVQDFIDVVTSMCARIYGQRAAKNRAKRALAAASLDEL
jgi:predicted site-specific integrase-resolvase